MYLDNHELHRQSIDKVNGIISFIYGTNGKKYRLTDNLYLVKLNQKITIQKE